MDIKKYWNFIDPRAMQSNNLTNSVQKLKHLKLCNYKKNLLHQKTKNYKKLINCKILYEVKKVLTINF